MENQERKGFVDYDNKENIFQELQGEKVGSIKEVIEDIEKLIDQREQLSKELFRDIEKIKTSINNFALALGDDANKGEQLSLRQKQVEIEEVALQEKVNCWRDVALLKKELRERVKEFKEREGRLNALDSILEK